MKHFFARTCRLPLPLSSRVFHPTPTISPKDTFARIPPLVSQHIFHILLTQSARNENGTDLPPEFQESRSFRVCYGVFLPGHPKPLLPPSPSLLPNCQQRRLLCGSGGGCFGLEGLRGAVESARSERRLRKRASGSAPRSA